MKLAYANSITAYHNNTELAHCLKSKWKGSASTNENVRTKMNGKHKLPWPYHTNKLAPLQSAKLAFGRMFQNFQPSYSYGQSTHQKLCHSIWKLYLYQLSFWPYCCSLPRLQRDSTLNYHSHKEVLAPWGFLIQLSVSFYSHQNTR